MEQSFVAEYPGLIIAILGFLFISVGSLAVVLIKNVVGQFKDSVDKVDQILTKLFSKYEDLDHRMTTQETICETCRLSCPERMKGGK